MKIAILGKWHKYCSYYLHGMLEGSIQNGHSAMGVEFITGGVGTARTALINYNPDIIFCHMTFSDEGERKENKMDMLETVKKRCSSRIFHQMGDPRTEPRYKKDCSSFLDGLLVSHREVDKFKVNNVPIYYFPYGTLKGEFCKRKLIKHKLAFAGSYPNSNERYTERNTLLSRLDEQFGITFYPKKNGANTTFMTNKLASKVGAFVNILSNYDIKDFLSLRPFQFIGAGALSIQKDMDGLDKVFIDEKHHLVFDNIKVDEVLDKYKYFVEDHPEKGEKIRRAGYEYCQKYHNYKNRVNDILEVISGEREEVRYTLEDF